VPESVAEHFCDLPTSPNLALLYRLNGDENPLHADPARARLAEAGRSNHGGPPLLSQTYGR